MVCLACLLPLFLVPIVNILPLLFDFILGKVYRLFGWEYRKPQRVPPSCPYNPSAKKEIISGEEPGAPHPIPKSEGANDVPLAVGGDDYEKRD